MVSTSPAKTGGGGAMKLWWYAVIFKKCIPINFITDLQVAFIMWRLRVGYI